MSGSVYLDCSCRDPVTRRSLHGRCPELQARARSRKQGHGAWYARYDAPRMPGEKRRQPVLGPFGTQKEAQDALAAAVTKAASGQRPPDRALLTGHYLDDYIAGKLDVKPSTLATDTEAMELYWKPALGHVRLGALQPRNIAGAITEMRKINRPQDDEPSDILQRMLDARGKYKKDDARARRLSTVPLSEARIRRVFAPLSAAMNEAVTVHRILVISPCAGIKFPPADREKPIAWTAGREKAFRSALAARTDGLDLTTVQHQEAWASPDLRPAPVMVWLPKHTGAFLDYAEDEKERFYPLYHLASYTGMRRSEIDGLTWPELDLDAGHASVRESKTRQGVRTIPLDAATVAVLRAWREQQDAERAIVGRAWLAGDRVFTRTDGTPVPAQWISRRFETLAFRADLPPVRFHDLRHGAASLSKLGGMDSRYIRELLGHSRTAFTDDTYVLLFPEVAQAGAEATAAVVPRARRSAT